jgi:hypothetical protein
VDDEALKLAEAGARGLIASLGGRQLDAAVRDLRNDGVTTGTSGFFRRLRFDSDTQPPLSQADRDGALKALFALHKVGDSSPEPVPTQAADAKGYLVLSLNGFRAASDSVFDQSEKTRRDSAVQDVSEAAYTYWTYARTAAAAVSLPLEIQRQMSGQEEANP